MTSKFHVKVGAVELDFEGESEFLKSDILPILTNLLSKPINNDNLEGVEKVNGSTFPPNLPNEKVDTFDEMSINSIAGILNAETGPDLVIAACAYLRFTEKKLEFPRNEILETMKKAHAYTHYMSSNLSKMLKRFVRNKELLEKRTDVFGFPPQKIEELGKKLAR